MSDLRAMPQVRIKPFSDVYISTGNGRIKTVLKRGLDELGGINKIIKPGQSVLIKPNLTAGEDPITGGTTDVKLCEALIELIMEYCDPGPVYCGENAETGNITMEAFRRYGYTDMCDRLGVELVDFTNSDRSDVHLPDAMYANVISLPKLILEVDVFITLALLKNHDSVCVTAAVKNSFGLVPDATRRQAHRDNAVEQYLVDIARIRKPDFAVVDGRIGMEGIAGGSYFDHPRFANRMIMGADPVAVDVVCAHVMAQNPRVRYLQWADEYDLGNCNLDYVNIRGMALADAVVPFMTPAGEIEEKTGGKINLIDLGSCSRCRAVAQGTLHRFHSPESILKRVDIVYGPGNWDNSSDRAENCLLVGECVQEAYRSLGTWIPGCPMLRDDYFNALTSMEIICSKCEQAVYQFIACHTPEELSFIRVLASNTTVFQGENNKAGVTDFLLAVGDCQRRYAHFHIKRGQEELFQMGIADKVNADFFVIHIPGHEPTAGELEDAFIELNKRMDIWNALSAEIKADQ